MSIAAGSRISRYEVLSKLGVGGMGEVYKAHDTTLDRNVALKILPPDLVQDQDRVRRFVQEAKSASALSHPHIITIYEIGEVKVDPSQVVESKAPATNSGEYSAPAVSSDIHYIAMELVDGETLHAKIYREKVELKKLLEYLIQTADGLAKAHSSGIVHRDLKPENIMVTHDEYAKILDFGLAKLVEQQKPESGANDITEADTAIMQRTQAGVVMGTVGYMSPEQVQGKTVDSRSDIFSFGCVLYEAAARHKPFEGESMIDTLHKIVYTPPPAVTEFNPDVPDELQRIIRKCLAKDPDERYQSMKDVAVDLRQLKREYDSGAMTTGAHAAVAHSTGSHPTVPTGYVSAPAVAPVERRKTKIWLPMAVAVGIIVAVVGGVAVYKTFLAKPSHPTYQSIKFSRLTNNGKISGVSISPDGKYVVYSMSDGGLQSAWVRQVATSTNVQIIPGSQANFGGFTFTADGSYVYYTSVDKGSATGVLYVIPALGGPPRKLITDVDSKITLSPDGKQLAFIRGEPSVGKYHLMVANVDGSGVKTLASRKLPDIYVLPDWSPDGKSIVCYAGSLKGNLTFGFVAVSLSDGSEKPVTDGKWLTLNQFAWMSDGSGLIMPGLDRSSGLTQIWMIPYPNGQPKKITNDLNNYTGVSLTADSRTIATIQINQIANIWTASGGNASLARQVFSGAGANPAVSWTPDGKLVYGSTSGGKPDVWQMDPDGSNQKQLTNDSRANLFPSVSPDGRYIVYCATRPGSGSSILDIWRADIDGGNPKQLTNGEIGLYPQVTPDGQSVVYVTIVGGKPTLWKVPIDGGTPIQLTTNISQFPAISPDGKMIACFYIDDSPNPKPSVAIFSIDGGRPIKTFEMPQSKLQWSADSRSIYFVDDQKGIGNIFSQPIDGSPRKQLTQFNSEQIFWFAWSRDEKQLACTRGTNATDAVLISDASQK